MTRTQYGPPDHEGLMEWLIEQPSVLLSDQELAARVARYADQLAEGYRHFARTARAVKLDELYRQFDLPWEEFCDRRK